MRIMKIIFKKGAVVMCFRQLTKIGITLTAVMIIATPASASIINGGFETGDLTGWTSWQSPWSLPAPTIQVQNGVVYDGNYALHLTASYSSFGVYQAIPTVPGTAYTIEALWKGNNLGGQLFWNEILFFNDDGRPIYEQLDFPLDSSVLSKVDAWGMNWPVEWDWKSPFGGDQWYPGGLHTNTIVATGTTMYVGLKAGTVSGNVDLFFDNIRVNAVPEPASLLLLGTGLGLAGLAMWRRKRS